MNARIISIGDELLFGSIQDSNFAYIASGLARIGVPVSRGQVVGDSIEDIKKALSDASSSDFIIVTGGLGPTEDDRTRQALAGLSGKKLLLDETCLAHIKEIFHLRRREMPESNVRQAMIPEGAEVIPNARGTACGICMKINKGLFFALPGVPAEMKAMLDGWVIPRIKKGLKAVGVLVERRINCFGISESQANEKIKRFFKDGANPKISLTVADGIISVRLIAKAPDVQSAEKIISPVEKELIEDLGECVFGKDEQTLAQVAGRMLIEKNRTLALAESCTGGLLAKMLTDVPGISKVFLQGYITYSNEAKEKLLGVPHDILLSKGAVSAEAARAMAEGARRQAASDLALSITGIAGPSGGSPEKPVGLVYIALVTEKEAGVKECRFRGERSRIRDLSARTALDMLRKYLLSL